MAVVTHHPVVVHLEGIAAGRLSVDVDAAVPYLQIVLLIHLDATLIDGEVLQCERDGLAFGRNPYRSVVVACPARKAVERIIRTGIEVLVRHQPHRLHQPLALQFGGGTLRQRHIAVILEYSFVEYLALVQVIAMQTGEALHVLRTDFEVLAEVIEPFSEEVGCGNVVELDKVRVLHLLRLLVWLSVKINDSVPDLQGLPRQADTTLDVVLAAVGRTPVQRSVSPGILDDISPARGIGLFVEGTLLEGCHCRQVDAGILLCKEVLAHGVGIMIEVIALIGRFAHDGVTGREVEDDNIIQLHLSQALHTAVVPVRPGNIALRVDDGKCVLRQRHGQGRFRYAGPIAYLRHEEVIAREERLLKR